MQAATGSPSSRPKLQGLCKQAFDTGVYVWGKPTAIGIVYYEHKGDRHDWLNPVKSAPGSTPVTLPAAKTFIESEDCDAIPQPSKRAFYPYPFSAPHRGQREFDERK